MQREPLPLNRIYPSTRSRIIASTGSPNVSTAFLPVSPIVSRTRPLFASTPADTCKQLHIGVAFSAASQPFGAGDNLDQFSGDVGLAGAVVVDCQSVDHLAGIARCIVHRGHSRALLAGRVFQ